MAPDGLTFDGYGTLVDWEGAIRPFLASAGVGLEAWHRLQWDLIRGAYLPYREVLARSLRGALAAVGRPPGAGDEARFADAFARSAPFPDTLDALRRLHTRFRLAVVSNTDRDLLETTLRGIGVPFDALVIAEDARAYKPDPAVFRLALARLGAAPDRVVHVAFGFEYDIGPAQSIGMRALWVNRKGEPKPPGATPDFEARDLGEAADLLLALGPTPPPSRASEAPPARPA